MLTPEYLDECLDYLLGMYDCLQTSIAQDVARRIMNTGTMTDSAAYQAKRAMAAGALMQDTAEKVASMSGLTDQEIMRLFNDAGLQNMKNDAKPLVDAGYDIDLTMSQDMAQQLNAAILKTQGNMRNLTLTTGSTVMGQYLEATNLAYMQVSSGAFSYYEAIARAIKQAATDGSHVTYGKSRSRLDVAIRRSVLTGVNQTCAKLTEMYSEDLGAEYYEVTAHSGARPSHAVWQGRVYKIEGSEHGYPNFQESTHYGDGNGLCGWNCRHSFYPYWPGISKPAYTKEKLAWYNERRFEYDGKKLTDYECSQIQRAYERDIREMKRVLSSYDAAIKANPGSLTAKTIQDKFNNQSVELKQKEADLRAFCKQTGRKPDSKRTQVVAYLDGNGRIVNFGRSTSMKAVWANRKNQ